ncbi:hypothetical protein QE406_003310 [Microbacterium testaceum]|uniref:hypothetical protein n=1 Tax=Microbacterium testaceum TaxID=2033 RepID=UPI00278769CF|nr:hypothetical protein [Microbacterium testaceum]MDQ1117301.1 hypothetical protein [Microbacterium testaceum]
MTQDVLPPAAPASARPRPVRRVVAVVSAVLVLPPLAVLLALTILGSRSEGPTEVIVGGWDSEAIAGASVQIALLAFVVAVCAIPARRWWLLLFVPLRLAACAALLLAAFAAALTGGSIVPVVADGCSTGYVVSERAFLLSARIEVLRVEGILATPVDSVQTDDGHTPFAQGSYMAVVEGDEVRVWHTFDSSTEPLATVGEPQLVLPRLLDPADAACGLVGGREPTAQLPPDPVSPDPDGGPRLSDQIGDTRDEVVRMASLALEAATGPVTDASGAPVSIPAASELVCDGSTGLGLTIATGDNEHSYAAILAAFDDAGYAKDRAMQEDLRDDGVIRLSARDRSTIDGMLHLGLSAACRLP